MATALTLVLIVWQRSAITAEFAAGGHWSLANFYGAVFNWSAIQAGFLFGAYAFFLSRTEPFIRAVSESHPFEQLRVYVKRTLYGTMMLAAVSAVILVATPAMRAEQFDFAFILFVAVSCALTYTVFSMLKVIRVFGKLERSR